MSHLQGPVTVSDQAHKMITILSRETDTALQDIELRGQSHLKWLEDITQSGIAKILEAGCPPRKKVKFSIGGNLDNKENAPASYLNISADKFTTIPCPPPPYDTDDSPVSSLDEDTVTVGIQNMKVKDLRESLKKRGLSTSGLKKDLQDRLLLAVQNNNNTEDVEDEIMEENKEETSHAKQQVPVVETSSTWLDAKANNNVSLSEGSIAATGQLMEPPMNLTKLGDKETEFHFEFHEMEPAENPSDSPHFSEEVAVPAIVPMGQVPAILSPKKKHNTLGKLMKATTKLFSPKRNKEQAVAPKLDSSPPVYEVEEKTMDVKMPEVKSDLSIGVVAAEVSYDAFVPNETNHPLPERVPMIPITEKPIKETYTIGKLSVCSTTSTSSSSSSAKIQAIRNKVREEQALKTKEAVAAAPLAYHHLVNKPSGEKVNFGAVKPSVEKARFAGMKEKMREQAKVNKVVSSVTTTNTILTAAATETPIIFTKTVAANPLDEKKKLLSLQMREKAAAEANKKVEVIHSFKAAANRHESVLMQIPPNNIPVATKQQEKEEQLPKSPMETYEMSDREGSSSSSEDEDLDEEKPPSKTIPEWAHKERLQKALEKQFGVNGQTRIDPDEVFGEVYTCDLSAIFGESKRFNKPRKETGDWKNDKITPMEQMIYKREMGFN